MSKAFQERRIHKIFVTRNSEYHVRRNLCVGVRDRATGEWYANHMAMRSTVSGGLRFEIEGAVSASDHLPSIGESLFFVAETRDLITSPVISVERPSKETVALYMH